jgi:enterochelin esterase-like enzyme
VGAYVAKEFGISTKREDRAVTGYSNGGAFSAAVAFRRPEFFGTAMPLSLGVPPLDGKPTAPMPRMFFAGGALESFGKHTQDVYEQVKAWGVESSMDLYIAGHDSAMWELAFSRLMPKAFPG